MMAIACVFIAYLLGSLPTGYLLGQYLCQRDIRQLGSGNTGATNALRTLGLQIGLTTFFVDAFKGMLALYLCFLTDQGPKTIALVMAAVELGHCYSLFLSFQGGKGVATFCGLLAMMDIRLFLVFGLVFVLVVLWTGLVSLASLSACLGVFLVACFLMPYAWPIKLALLLLLALIFYRHKSNILKLRQGQEYAFGRSSFLKRF